MPPQKVPCNGGVVGAQVRWVGVNDVTGDSTIMLDQTTDETLPRTKRRANPAPTAFPFVARYLAVRSNFNKGFK